MSCGPSCATIGADPPVECLAAIDPVRFGHVKRWCEGDDPLWRRHSLARSRLGPDLNAYVPPPAPAPQGAGDCPEPAQPANPTFAAHLANIAKVKACPSWEATSSCGCGMNRCRAGKGRESDNGVSYQDCFTCLDLG